MCGFNMVWSSNACGQTPTPWFLIFSQTSFGNSFFTSFVKAQHTWQCPYWILNISLLNAVQFRHLSGHVYLFYNATWRSKSWLPPANFSPVSHHNFGNTIPMYILLLWHRRLMILLLFLLLILLGLINHIVHYTVNKYRQYIKCIFP